MTVFPAAPSSGPVVSSLRSGLMTVTRVLRVGTRGSALARAQTDLVVAGSGTPVEVDPDRYGGRPYGRTDRRHRRNRRVRLRAA